MIGGGLDSFMGPIHLKAIEKAGNVRLATGAFGSIRQTSLACQEPYGLAGQKVYGTYREFFRAQARLPKEDRVLFVTAPLPNTMHYPVAMAAIDAGIPVLYHNCGRCEDLLPPMVRLGVKIWDPAQVENDLTEVKNRFGRQLIINGGFEFKPRDIEAVTEEEAREVVRDHFERLAPNGGWIFGGMVQSLDFMNPKVQQINAWIKDEAEKLSVEFYKH